MNKNRMLAVLRIGAFTFCSILALNRVSAQNGPPDPLRLPEEKHLRNIRQLTFGGENAEAYFSADDSKLIFQYHTGGDSCDQIYTMNADGSEKRLVSTGKGRTTCGYFFPDGKKILFSSTHLADSACPSKPDYSKGYVWPLYSGYDIFTANSDGANLQRLTATNGYDAEATISRDGQKIVFTSSRNGDLNIYTMNDDGSGLMRLTDETGYDGGPFFSYDGKKICYRAHHPKDSAARADY
ncbi:MAG: TolB family protein, partial [Limisphaerales bacterium]